MGVKSANIIEAEKIAIKVPIKIFLLLTIAVRGIYRWMTKSFQVSVSSNLFYLQNRHM